MKIPKLNKKLYDEKFSLLVTMIRDATTKLSRSYGLDLDDIKLKYGPTLNMVSTITIRAFIRAKWTDTNLKTIYSDFFKIPFSVFLRLKLAYETNLNYRLSGLIASKPFEKLNKLQQNSIQTNYNNLERLIHDVCSTLFPLIYILTIFYLITYSDQLLNLVLFVDFFYNHYLYFIKLPLLKPELFPQVLAVFKFVGYKVIFTDLIYGLKAIFIFWVARYIYPYIKLAEKEGFSKFYRFKAFSVYFEKYDKNLSQFDFIFTTSPYISILYWILRKIIFIISCPLILYNCLRSRPIWYAKLMNRLNPGEFYIPPPNPDVPKSRFERFKMFVIRIKKKFER